MTVEDMRTAISVHYEAALREYGVELAQIPEGVTPLAWDLSIPFPARDLSPSTFDTQYAEPYGKALAAVGVLEYGCTSFALLRVQDRPEVKVASQGGRGIARKRPRVFIVHALGWGVGRTN